MSLPSPGRRRIVTWLAFFPWPLVLFQFLFIVPRYDRLFRDYNLQIAGPTSVLFQISAWLRANAIVGYSLALVLTGVSVFAADFVQSRPTGRWRRILILLLVFGVPCLVFVVCWLGVLSTHRRLIEGLNR
jgi:type II secretory pathway component PulF